MAANIPNASGVVPGAYAETQTIQSGVSVPIGTRIPVIIGEGLKNEILVSSALGNGKDGFNSTYTSTKNSDGRHFVLGNGTDVVAPIVEGRSVLYKNGVTLNLIEGAITDTFDSRYDAMLDPNTGEILLQAAYIVDQSGSQYSAAGSNVGNGSITNLELVDVNAQAETWTIRCSSVRRDGYGNPIDGYAKFTARGSVSGIVLDGYGNTIVWQSNGTIVSNGILSFSIVEGAIAFQEGDNFAIEIAGGALVRGDSLSADYISTLDLNDPEYFTDLNTLVAKHGQPSATNRLSLAAQLAFSNGTPGVYTIQAKPSVPRRVSYDLVESATGHIALADLTFELPLNITPDANDNINFFVTSASTGTELQIIPNKVDFYNSSITANPSSFVFGGSYHYSYTVVLEESVQKQGTDGVLTVLTPTTATFSSSSVAFGVVDLAATRSLQIQDSTLGNDGTFTITGISQGKLLLSSATPFGGTESGITFLVLDSSTTSARILFTQDLALGLGEKLRATVIDTKDADFYDAGWLNAYAAAEKIDVDMVVPVPSQTISVIFQNGKVHVEEQSQIQNKHERILMIGAIQGLTPDNVLGNKDAAVENIGILEGIQGATVSDILSGNTEDLANYSVTAAYGDSFRVVYFYPDQIVVQAGANNILVDGFFMAAAAAGYFSGSTKINEPLTNKRLSGFTIQKSKIYSPTVVQNIVNNGITLLTPVTGGGLVVWGETTISGGEPTEQEISIIFIRDAIAGAMRSAFKPYIGRAATASTKATLFAVAQSLMNTFIQQQLITAYSGLTVQRDSTEPRQWNITVAVQPVYPINWIYIKIGVGNLGK